MQRHIKKNSGPRPQNGGGGSRTDRAKAHRSAANAAANDRRQYERYMELARTAAVNPEALKYLNRLSDHLFVLGRRVNDGGARDVLWRPGANR